MLDLVPPRCEKGPDCVFFSGFFMRCFVLFFFFQVFLRFLYVFKSLDFSKELCVGGLLISSAFKVPIISF